jgi:GcrA cell cycle regulator
MDWTDETILRLREFWAEGHSTAEIGRRLGVSKNAIVGKAHRLDLPARPSPIRREGNTETATRRAPVRRVEGPTLPPLASTDPAASSTVTAMISPTLAPASPDSPVLEAQARTVAASLPPLADAQGMPSQEPMPPVLLPPVMIPARAPLASQTGLPPDGGGVVPARAPDPRPAESRPVAIGQRPVIVAPPRPAAAAPRPYARVVTCCWPIGEPGTKSFRFCDDPSDPGKPYCGEHAKLAYVKVRDRREDAA